LPTSFKLADALTTCSFRRFSSCNPNANPALKGQNIKTVRIRQVKLLDTYIGGGGLDGCEKNVIGKRKEGHKKRYTAHGAGLEKAVPKMPKVPKVEKGNGTRCTAQGAREKEKPKKNLGDALNF
jgi:hypothetical protein